MAENLRERKEPTAAPSDLPLRTKPPVLPHPYNPGNNSNRSPENRPDEHPDTHGHYGLQEADHRAQRLGGYVANTVRFRGSDGLYMCGFFEGEADGGVAYSVRHEPQFTLQLI